MTKWERNLRKHFRGIVWVQGDGPFAALFPCRDLTVYLFDTEEAAEAWIERVGNQCGGRCMGEHFHFVVDLHQSDAELQEVREAEMRWFYSL